MNDAMNFRFALPALPKGPVIEMSQAEAECFLLNKLEEDRDKPIDALWQIAHFYKNSRQHEKAMIYLHRLMALMPSVEEKANCVFTMGQAMENVGDYEGAVRYYKEALAFEPTHTFTWYFINNNLGFSLNTLGDFHEGERYCRKAIEIDPSRPNAFKNLGLALSGQGRYSEAAECFVAATQVNAADARSFHLLQKLLVEHPELEYEFKTKAESCGEAIKFAAQKANELKPIVHRGFRKRLTLWRLKLTAFNRKVRAFLG